MNALIWIDWVVIGIIALSTLISLWRGFVREAMSLVVWIGAFVIARTFHPNMQALLTNSIEAPTIRLIVAFAVLFIGTLIVGTLVSNLLARLVKATGLSATDRVLGTVFGLARGVVVVVVALALLRMTPVTEDAWWDESVTVDEFGRVEEWSRSVFGDELDRLLPGGDEQQEARDQADRLARDGAEYLIKQQLPEIPENRPEPDNGS